MSKQNQALKTITVATLLCLVCSVAVSSLVVQLRPMQAKNAELDMKKNILRSAGLIDGSATAQEVESTFAKVDTMIIDLETGRRAEGIDASSYDQVAATKNPEYMVEIPDSEDVGGLSTRSKYAKVYVTKTDSGEIDSVILNHWGKGLWSTMYGFIALGPDMNTVKGFAYYAQGETPGLGGEVDNQNWKEQWIGKKIYEDQEVEFKVAKGEGQGEHQVDGLSGATITSNGVTYSIQYWFGDHGYKTFLENVRQGEI